MVIKKIFKLISKTEKKYLMNKNSAINSVGVISTLNGGRKVMFLKKIGSKKKMLIRIIN